MTSLQDPSPEARRSQQKASLLRRIIRTKSPVRNTDHWPPNRLKAKAIPSELKTFKVNGIWPQPSATSRHNSSNGYFEGEYIAKPFHTECRVPAAETSAGP